jgi:bifunctional UDP-N-acetylglucosamine pyrophosphorylase/glucosamine-1-phosphate N-acetyltransferase
MTTKHSLQALVLAAGTSTRFKSETPKLLFTICGQEMLLYPLRALQHLAIPVTLVIGHRKEQIKRLVEHHNFEAISFVEQKQQLGTGHAVAATMPAWYADNILVMNGDIPLITPQLIQELIEQHERTHATISFITAHNSDPSSAAGYGRVVTHHDHMSIVEMRDFTDDPSVYPFVNAGVYIFQRDFLRRHINSLKTHDNSREIYLPDLIEIASKQGLKVTTVTAVFDHIRGINTLKELWIAEQIKRAEIIEHWMLQGVRFTYAQSTHIDIDVHIGEGTCIESGVQLLTGTRIGRQCHIGAFSSIKSSVLAHRVTIKNHSIICDATIGESSIIGPFAYIHNNTNISAESVVGFCVEVSKSSLEHNTKVKHLSYIGNGHVGPRVTIGAGTIFCNYDGKSKHTTVVEHDAFIGSNTSLVAPVTVGHHAITGAGSTITQDVPPHALAIARSRQENKDGYAHKIRGSVPVGGAVKMDESS